MVAADGRRRRAGDVAMTVHASDTAAAYTPDFVTTSEDLSASPLWNHDLAPTPIERRTWSTYNIAALWIGMSVVITTYTLASGLMSQGMNWWQAMVTILLGQRDRAHSDGAQRARRHAIRHFVSGTLSRAVRRERRERCGDAARDRRVRLVRHPDVDRRAGARYPARRGVERLVATGTRQAHRLRDFLVGPGRDHSQGHGGYQSSRKLVGAPPARRRTSASRVGNQERRRAESRSAPSRRSCRPDGRRSGPSFPPRSRRTSATGRRSASTSRTSPATRKASGRRCSGKHSGSRRR